MTDIKPGDHVRVTFEGRVVERYKIVDDWVRVKTEGMGILSAKIAHCTVIDPPVRVGDEISYEQAQRLPGGSAVLGLDYCNARYPDVYSVRRDDLWWGARRIDCTNQTFRVLHIQTEATS